MVDYEPAMAPMHLAMIGTRGVPAAYGGFETAVEEIGSRLAGRGHDVTVYCRHAEDAPEHDYAGMHLVHLPALHLKAAETLSHTALSVAHVTLHRHRPDAAFVFNAANAPFVPVLHACGVPVAVHVDGLEWQRDKWHGAGRAYYRWAEQSAVRNADALIADAKGISDYYASEFGAPTRQWVPGYPLEYNLLRVSRDDITVETRCRREVNGAWAPDARWLQGPGEDPLPRYVLPRPRR